MTAWRWCRDDRMPCRWHKTASGTILVTEEEITGVANLATHTYSRVSSTKQKDDLVRQAARCAAFCEANGWSLTSQTNEIASGMNDKRPKLIKLLSLPPGRLVVENKDRLTRFGFNYIDLLLTKLGWELVVINETECDEQDILDDMTSIITSFCCRIYGLRRGRDKAKKIVNDSLVETRG